MITNEYKEHPDKCPGCSSQLFGSVAYCPFCGKQMAVDTLPPPPLVSGPSIKGLAITTIDKTAITIRAIAEGYEGSVVDRAEYWVGDDPGLGKGNPMKAASGSFKSSREDVTITINIASFKPGDHLIHVRSADIRGIWGEPQTVFYTKAAEVIPPKTRKGGNIANAEYWIGDDPGPGKGKHMNGAFGSPRVDISISIDVSEYKPGNYTVQVRCADEQGAWGKPHAMSFTREQKKPDRTILKIAIACVAVLLVAILGYRAFHNGAGGNGGTEGPKGPTGEVARAVASETLRQGTDLSVTISKIPKLENVLQAAKKLQDISPRYQDQVTSAESTVQSARKTRDKYLMAYISKALELSRYTPEQISYALRIVQNGDLTSREKIVCDLLTEHINDLRSGTKANPSKMLLDYNKRFSNFVD
jgi:hypothetical protein